MVPIGLDDGLTVLGRLLGRFGEAWGGTGAGRAVSYPPERPSLEVAVDVCIGEFSPEHQQFPFSLAQIELSD
jgi:hypothetical protein